MWSYWEKESFIGKPDLLVIGSGIVGLNAALEYKQNNPNANIIVLEAGHLPSGASTKNAGFACFGSPSELLMDLENASEELVLSLLEKRLKGLERLRTLLGDNKLEYLEPGSFELFTSEDADTYNNCIENLSELNQKVRKQIGFEPYEIRTDVIDKFGFSGMMGAIQVKGEGQINTGKMMFNLIELAKSKGIQILNGIGANNLTQNEHTATVNTSFGNIEAAKCLIATNGFGKELIGEVDLNPARAQVLITKPIENLNIEGTFHFDCGYYYFRNINNRILFGGGRNLDYEGETTSENKLNDKIQNALTSILKEKILPNTTHEVDYRWTGIMGVGENKKAIVKQLDKNIFCSVKLGGMGVAIGSLIGQEAAILMQD